MKDKTQRLTMTDVVNQFATHAMEKEVLMGVRRLSYAQFKRKAREHQIKFREEYLTPNYHRYENVLTYADARKGLIFYEGFRKEIMEELRKPVAPTSAAPSGQMLTNLLRSEHIPYNIFFPMKKDLEGARALFSQLLSTKEIKRIDDILIEYHPMPIEEYLGDHTAFDVYIPYTDTEDRPCGIGIEVKYTEKEYPLKPGSTEESHVKNEQGETCLYPPYARATRESGYYKEDVNHDILVSNKMRQIWRNHILGASMVLHGDIAHFTSMTLFPRENVHFFIDAMPQYKALLTDNGFRSCIPLTYEYLFDCMERFLHIDQKEDWVKYLRQRYLIKNIIQ